KTDLISSLLTFFSVPRRRQRRSRFLPRRGSPGPWSSRASDTERFLRYPNQSGAPSDAQELNPRPVGPPPLLVLRRLEIPETQPTLEIRPALADWLPCRWETCRR